ncbi:uncharacterized protein LOC112637824 [Camponotus floridanus]|uniref:uncharacterized protein LOC112637824 n=1 Tax=Camponotus floridanus TaxID=104421 RepID=UPI00059CB600|nr:uncharacterized protein LOC112637824 [Camponotus floridanus]
MKLLFLLSLIILVSGGEVLVTEKIAGNNDISPQAGTLFQAQPSVLEVLGGKKLGKRGLLPAAYVDTYTPVLPWYRLGGLSNYGLYGYGWHPGWSLRDGWYKGW